MAFAPEVSPRRHILTIVLEDYCHVGPVSRVIRPGGLLYLSVPWVWRYHPYPDDYFRFSHRGVISLFEQFEWSRLFYSTTIDNEFAEIEDPPVDRDSGADNRMAIQMAVQLPAGEAKRKYLPYLMVNMLGRRRAAAA